MKRQVLAACALAVGLGASTSLAADGLAPSADRVQPLLIGAKPPALTLKTGDGSDFDLTGAFSKSPTVLIFYRGGW